VWFGLLALFLTAHALPARALEPENPEKAADKEKTPPPTTRRGAPPSKSKSKPKAKATHKTHRKAQSKSPRSSKKGKSKSKRAYRNPRRDAPLGPPESPAIRYGALDSQSCLRELRNRGVSFHEEPSTPGVSIPVRLIGPLAGVLYRTDLSDRQRKTTPWEIFDCRLVLSLHDFGRILNEHGISEVRIFSAYRPPPKKAGAQGSKRHQAALAVDVRTLRKESGDELSVLDHFEQKLGSDPCSEAREPSDPAAKELKAIACEAAREHIFNSILTPNFDERHRNHFHLEVTPGKGWFLLR
jgi:hypothetical protein